MKTIKENRQRIYASLLSFGLMLLTVASAHSASPTSTTFSQQTLQTLTAVKAETAKQDSLVQALKYKELGLRKSDLESRIEKEDAKRNQQLQGVTPERQEELNDRQDSICLSLRSELVSVELQMAEIHPEGKLSEVLGRLGSQYVHQPAENGNESQSPLHPYVEVTPGQQTQHGEHGFTPYVEIVPQKQQTQQTQQGGQK